MFLLTFLVTMWVISAAASAEPVVVEAENYGLWQGQERVFAAYGGVRVTQGDTVIEADNMRYDVDADEVLFDGHVIYRDPDNELQGAALRYHVGRREGWLEEAEGVLWSEEVGEPIFLFGEQIHRDPEHLRLTRARLTTCDPTQPPYHFAAREIEIYPGDRIVLRSVTFVEHGIPVLYWPYWVLSLKERDSRFDFPQFGYSERDGWYVKNTYNYYLDSGDYGSAYIDYYQRRGVGGGARHVYKDDAQGKGELYLYTVSNPEGGDDYAGEWKRSWRLRSGLELATRVGYELSERPGEDDHEEWDGEWNVEQVHSRGSYQIGGSYEKKEPDSFMRVDTSGSWLYRLDNDWRLSVRGSYYRYLNETETTTYDRRRIAYLARAERRWSNYTLAIDLEQRIHPDIVKLKDEEKDPDPNWRSMHRLPEVSLSSSQRFLNLPFTLRGSIGHFREYPGETEAWRGSGSIIMRGYSVPLSRKSSINVRGTVTGYTYETKQNQLSFDSRLTWTYNPWRPLRLSTEYHYREAWGDTPFNFDRVTSAETISPRAQWMQGPWSFLVNSRYDLRTEQWSPIVGSAAYRLGSLDARLYTSYSLQKESFEKVVATVELSERDRYRIRLGARYDVENQQWTRWDIDGSIPLGWGWSLGATVMYEPHTERFYRGWFKLTKDLGCREFSISYDHMDEEYWFEYRIYAFPLSRVRVGRSEDEDFLFESDILKELMEE